MDIEWGRRVGALAMVHPPESWDQWFSGHPMDLRVTLSLRVPAIHFSENYIGPSSHDVLRMVIAAHEALAMAAASVRLADSFAEVDLDLWASTPGVQLADVFGIQWEHLVTEHDHWRAAVMLPIPSRSAVEVESVAIDPPRVTVVLPYASEMHSLIVNPVTGTNFVLALFGAIHATLGLGLDADRESVDPLNWADDELEDLEPPESLMRAVRTTLGSGGGTGERHDCLVDIGCTNGNHLYLRPGSTDLELLQ